MKLKIKLPLAFAAALGLLFLGAMFGTYQLNQSLSVFEKDVHDTVAAHKKVAEIDAIMATGIQEWKNTPLHHRNATQYHPVVVAVAVARAAYQSRHQRSSPPCRTYHPSPDCRHRLG